MPTAAAVAAAAVTAKITAMDAFLQVKTQGFLVLPYNINLRSRTYYCISNGRESINCFDACVFVIQPPMIGPPGVAIPQLSAPFGPAMTGLVPAPGVVIPQLSSSPGVMPIGVASPQSLRM